MTEKECADALMRFYANPQNDRRDCTLFSELIREYFKLADKETPKKIQFNVPQQPFLRKKYGKNARYDGICPSCHKSIFPGYKYCPNCGQKLDWEWKK